MTMLSQQEFLLGQNLVMAIEDLTEAIKPETFHNRQVPALQRQTKALEYLREVRQTYIDWDENQITKEGCLIVIDRAIKLLLSS